jgi:cell division septum initiation protein DivIVA
MRFLIRIGVLALAAFGAKTLYEKYSPRAQELKQPASDFIDRAKGAANRTSDQMTSAAQTAAQQMTDAAKDMTDELRTAAGDAAHDAAERVDQNPMKDHANSGV